MRRDRDHPSPESISNDALTAPLGQAGRHPAGSRLIPGDLRRVQPACLNLTPGHGLQSQQRQNLPFED